MERQKKFIPFVSVVVIVLAAVIGGVVLPSSPSQSQEESTAQTSDAATARATPDEDASPEPDDETAGDGTPIIITADGQTITAVLNDSQVSQDFIASLPTSLTWYRNFGIEYITELSAPLTETGPFYTDVQAGDLVYYNPMDSITIIYAPTSSVPTLTKMGEITSELEVFESLPDNVEMRIEVASE